MPSRTSEAQGEQSVSCSIDDVLLWCLRRCNAQNQLHHSPDHISFLSFFPFLHRNNVTDTVYTRQLSLLAHRETTGSAKEPRPTERADDRERKVTILASCLRAHEEEGSCKRKEEVLRIWRLFLCVAVPLSCHITFFTFFSESFSSDMTHERGIERVLCRCGRRSRSNVFGPARLNKRHRPRFSFLRNPILL